MAGRILRGYIDTSDVQIMRGIKHIFLKSNPNKHVPVTMIYFYCVLKYISYKYTKTPRISSWINMPIWPAKIKVWEIFHFKGIIYFSPCLWNQNNHCVHSYHADCWKFCKLTYRTRDFYLKRYYNWWSNSWQFQLCLIIADSFSWLYHFLRW